jgi:predicted nucleic acid-binding protein
MPTPDEAGRQRQRTASPIVFDTSSLIFLDRLGYIPALRQLHGEIVIPGAVAHELARRPGMPAAPVPELDWIEIRDAPDALLARVLAVPPSLDAGETEAIALALGNGATVVLDDMRGRERARRLGVALTGTIGELLALQ